MEWPKGTLHESLLLNSLELFSFSESWLFNFFFNSGSYPIAFQYSPGFQLSVNISIAYNPEMLPNVWLQLQTVCREGLVRLDAGKSKGPGAVWSGLFPAPIKAIIELPR